MEAMGLHHIELHASNLEASEKFYDLLLPHLGFHKYLDLDDMVAYTDGSQNLIFAQADVAYLRYGFHRKRVGLNHLAFRVPSRREVETIYRNVAMPNRLWVLYGGPQTYHEYHPEYYALYLEDPDRIKIEIVYTPEHTHTPKYQSTEHHHHAE
jgi:catechol 2,3-dioxygenase-like lactoylglutathione lyase family enzyme